MKHFRIAPKVEPLDPIDFVDALGEVVGERQPLDPEIGLRFPERRDHWRLAHDYSVIELLVAVAAEPCPIH